MKKPAASSTAGSPSVAPSEPPPSYETSQQTTPTAPRARPQLDMPALNAVRGKRIILASASPRRRALLAQIGLASEVEVVPSSFAEDLPKAGLSPIEYCLRTATEKCVRVYEREVGSEERGEPALVLAADTVVVSCAGDVLEKPRSFAEHVAMLKMLRDSGTHRVFTAVACMAPLESLRDPGYALETAVEETAVQFDPNVSDELIVAYVKTREGIDKAGGYGIQGLGSILVERIEGSFDNVVGLPLRATLQLIEKVTLAENSDDKSDG